VVESWSPGERAQMVRRSDNLHAEGDFTSKPDVKWSPGDRAKVIKHNDNLRVEGDFTSRTKEVWHQGGG